MKTVLLDGYSINPGDISWKPVESLVNLTCYERSSKAEVLKRVKNADGIFVSKCLIDKEVIDSAPNLKFIGVTATGYDNIDLIAAKEKGIAVYNVPSYSTDAVAQHTFALILEISNQVGSYNQDIHSGKWYNCKDFLFYNKPLMLLSGKSLGIIGYGSIGKRVANIAKAFGMEVNIFSKDKDKTIKSDILSLHCPATKENLGFINNDFISSMKDGAILINTARGSLLNSDDVADALNSGKLSAAGIDVLDSEPPHDNHPLIEAKNCYLTPHIAWSPMEMRLIVIDTCAKNISDFINSEKGNRII
ncbi:MAG: D-2-hydroxyacid dehydrogenase [Clostridiales bacterium]|nr:D-2-hydroxyacid dehydrogenase [Clostridiales bacterium]